MGAGTATATFFRSLGGSVGVAALGAVMSNRLASALAPLVASAVRRLPPDVAAQFAGRTGSISINDPASIHALPAPLRDAVEQGFVQTLHPIFLVAGLVSLVAVALCLALPDRELRGAGPTGQGALEPGRQEAVNEALIG
jgi:hypothetical protein